MKDFIIYNTVGEILQTGTVMDSMLHLQANESVGRFMIEGTADIRTQYVDVKTKELRTYTEMEQLTRRTLPKGWVWVMPERVARDMRTPEQRAKDTQAAFNANRARAYPPMQDFIDAMYWQSRGDSSKMEAYLAACDKVKQDFPKPNVSQG